MKNSLTISRSKKGNKFIYENSEGELIDQDSIERIQSLAIPPAWKEVRISHSDKSKVLAIGYDAAGRQQAIYSPSFRAKQEKIKFDRMLRFALALPKLRRSIEKDLRLKRMAKNKVLACIVKLIDSTYIRVGNERYAKANKSYGITTLRHKHLDLSGDTVTFDFVGKSGQEHVKQITDKQIARIVKRLDELPGYEIFRYQDEAGRMHDIDSGDVNAYIKLRMGDEFSAKDFRTWGGTLVAATELLAAESYTTKNERQKMITRIVKNVARQLGNTPAIARGSYIDPRVIAVYMNNSELTDLKRVMTKMHPKKYMSRDELGVVHILTKS